MPSTTPTLHAYPPHTPRPHAWQPDAQPACTLPFNTQKTLSTAHQSAHSGIPAGQHNTAHHYAQHWHASRLRLHEHVWTVSCARTSLCCSSSHCATFRCWSRRFSIAPPHRQPAAVCHPTHRLGKMRRSFLFIVDFCICLPTREGTRPRARTKRWACRQYTGICSLSHIQMCTQASVKSDETVKSHMWTSGGG